MLTNEYVAQDTADRDDRLDERALDDRYQGDVLTLAAVFRIDIAAAATSDPVQSLADVLWRVRRHLMTGQPNGAQVCQGHGPEAVLRALLLAYTTPQEVSDEVVHL